MPSKVHPCLPLWLDDFEAHLHRSQEPTIATGARIRLWAVSYRAGGYLPTDDHKLATWAGVSLEEWEHIRSYLVDSWEPTRDGKRYLLKRVKAEVARAKQRSVSAKRSADAKWAAEKAKARTQIDANAMRTLCDGNAPFPSHPFPTLPIQDRGKARAASRPPRVQPPTPPAILAFRDGAHRFPPKAGWTLICETVGDRIDEWREHVTAWVLHGYNPANVQGILERFISDTQTENGGKPK